MATAISTYFLLLSTPGSTPQRRETVITGNSSTTPIEAAVVIKLEIEHTEKTLQLFRASVVEEEGGSSEDSMDAVTLHIQVQDSLLFLRDICCLD